MNARIAHDADMAKELASFRTEPGASALAQQIADAIHEETGIRVTKSQVLSGALWDGLQRAAEKYGVQPKKKRGKR